MPMKNPPHPGRIVRQDGIEALNLSVKKTVELHSWERAGALWALARSLPSRNLTVTKTAELLGVTRQALNNLVNEKAGISAEMAIRLEKLGWSTADQWMRLQAAYNLAQARHKQD